MRSCNGGRVEMDLPSTESVKFAFPFHAVSASFNVTVSAGPLAGVVVAPTFTVAEPFVYNDALVPAYVVPLYATELT